MKTLPFPAFTSHLDDLGNLPITYIGSSISCSLPTAERIIESTELSGIDAVEEIANIDDIEKLRDPLKERLMEAVKAIG